MGINKPGLENKPENYSITTGTGGLNTVPDYGELVLFYLVAVFSIRRIKSQV